MFIDDSIIKKRDFTFFLFLFILYTKNGINNYYVIIFKIKFNSIK